MTCWHLSPDGNDGASGTAEAPFRTLERALAASRTESGRPRSIHLAPGIYRVGGGAALDSRDDYLSIIGADPANTVISGSSPLEELHRRELPGQVWEVDLPDSAPVDRLLAGNELLRMCRFPEVTDKNAVYGVWELRENTGADPRNDPLSPENLRRYADPRGAYLHGLHDRLWGDMHWQVTGRNADGSLQLHGGWQNNRPSGIHPRYRYLENVREELRHPGTFCHSSHAKRLWVIFPEEPDQLFQVTATQLFELEHCREVCFRNLRFSHTRRTFMENRERLLRSDWTLFRGGALCLRNSKGCRIDNCDFVHLGGNALMFDGENRNHAVARSLFHSIGGNGVLFAGRPEAVRSPLYDYDAIPDRETLDRTPGPRSDDFPADCRVADCLFHHTGKEEKQTAPVQISMSRCITVEHCTIYRTPRAGINISEGTWGGHLITHCDVFDTVLETGDHGSFNSWGRDRFWTSDLETVNRRAALEPDLPFADATLPNRLHHNRWRCDHGWGIDLDDGSSNYVITDNLILAGGLKLREGFRRIVRNNLILSDTLHAHCWYANSEDEFTGNLVFGPYRTARMEHWGKQVDCNLFACAGGFAFEGCDLHSFEFFPLFRDPAGGDYTILNLPEQSPFRNFDMEGFGVVSPRLKDQCETVIFPLPRQQSNGTESVEFQWNSHRLRQMGAEEYSAYGVSRGTHGWIVLEDGAGLKTGDLITRIGRRELEVYRNQKHLTLPLL